MFRVCAAKTTIKGFGAQDVINMAEVIALHWKVFFIRKAPTRRAVGPGSESKAEHRLRTIGNSTPPARAVLEGIAGAIIRSLIAKA